MNRIASSDGDGLSDLKLELIELERRLRVELGAGGPFLRQEGLRLLDSGGKRLRPAMCIAAGHLGSYDRDRTLAVAGAIELIHMATLVHDDVIDGSSLRRGTPTTFANHGSHTAVYMGDWMLVKAIRALSTLGRSDSGTLPSVSSADRLHLPDLLVEGLESVCSGEVDQYLGRGRIPGVRTYLSRVEKKTAALFAAACAAGAAAVGLDESAVHSCAAFGRAYGIAFQIKDDLLDVASSTESIGKPVSHDLRQGIATLPFLLAARKDKAFKTRLDSFFRSTAALRISHPEAGSALPSHFDLTGAIRALTAEMVALGGIQAAQEMVLKYTEEAKEHLATLPASRGRDMLALLAGLPVFL